MAHLRRRGAVQMIEENPPGRPQPAVVGEHLIEAVGLARIVGEQGARHGAESSVKNVFHHGGRGEKRKSRFLWRLRGHPTGPLEVPGPRRDRRV
jgi:hypothetical protein